MQNKAKVKKNKIDLLIVENYIASLSLGSFTNLRSKKNCIFMEKECEMASEIEASSQPFSCWNK